MNLIHSNVGWLHMVSSIAAVVLGTTVLINRKGNASHKRIGYAYSVAMLLVNSTAFGLYHLTGKFGPFHFSAAVSLATVFAGMVPMYFRHMVKSWMMLHFSFMYYSVIGLYAALVSEIIVRVPGIRFWWSIAGATAITMAVGIWIFQLKQKNWLQEVADSSSTSG